MSHNTIDCAHALVFQCLFGGRTFETLGNFKRTLKVSKIKPGDLADSVSRIKNNTQANVGHLIGLCVTSVPNTQGFAILEQAIDRQLFTDCNDLFSTLRIMRDNGIKLNQKVRDFIQKWCITRSPVDLVLDPGLPQLQKLVVSLPKVKQLTSDETEILYQKLAILPNTALLDMIRGLSWVEKNVAAVWYLRNRVVGYFSASEDDLIQHERFLILTGSPSLDVFNQARGLTHRVLNEGKNAELFCTANVFRSFPLAARLHNDVLLHSGPGSTDWIKDHLEALNAVLFGKTSSSDGPETRETIALQNAYKAGNMEFVTRWISGHGLRSWNSSLLSHTAIAESVCHRMDTRTLENVARDNPVLVPYLSERILIKSKAFEPLALRIVLDLRCCDSKKEEVAQLVIKILETRGASSSDVVVLGEKGAVFLASSKLDASTIIDAAEGEYKNNFCMPVYDALKKNQHFDSFIYLVGSSFKDPHSSLQTAIARFDVSSSDKTSLVVCWVSPRENGENLAFAHPLITEMDLNQSTLDRMSIFLDSVSICKSVSASHLDDLVSKASCAASEETTQGVSPHKHNRDDKSDEDEEEERNRNYDDFEDDFDDRRRANNERNAAMKAERQFNNTIKGKSTKELQIAFQRTSKYNYPTVGSDDEDGENEGNWATNKDESSDEEPMSPVELGMELEKELEYIQTEITVNAQEIRNVKIIPGPNTKLYKEAESELSQVISRLGEPGKSGLPFEVEKCKKKVAKRTRIAAGKPDNALDKLKGELKHKENELGRVNAEKKRLETVLRVWNDAAEKSRRDEAEIVEAMKEVENQLSELENNPTPDPRNSERDKKSNQILHARLVELMEERKGIAREDDDDSISAKKQKISKLNGEGARLEQEKKNVEQELLDLAQRGSEKPEKHVSKQHHNHNPVHNEGARKREIFVLTKSFGKTPNEFFENKSSSTPLRDLEFETKPETKRKPEDDIEISTEPEVQEEIKKALVVETRNRIKSELSRKTSRKEHVKTEPKAKTPVKKAAEPVFSNAPSEVKYGKKVYTEEWGVQVVDGPISQIHQERFEYTEKTGFGTNGDELSRNVGEVAIPKTVGTTGWDVYRFPNKQLCSTSEAITKKFIPSVMKTLRDVPYHAWTLFNAEFYKVFYYTCGDTCPELLSWEDPTNPSDFVSSRGKSPVDNDVLYMVLALKKLCQVMNIYSLELRDLLSSVCGFSLSGEPLDLERLNYQLVVIEQLSGIRARLLNSEEMKGDQYTLFAHVYEVTSKLHARSNDFAKEINLFVQNFSETDHTTSDMVKVQEILEMVYVMGMLMDLLAVDPSEYYSESATYEQDMFETLAGVLVKCENRLQSLEERFQGIEIGAGVRECMKALWNVYHYLTPYQVAHGSLSEGEESNVESFEDRYDLEVFFASLEEGIAEELGVSYIPEFGTKEGSLVVLPDRISIVPVRNVLDQIKQRAVDNLNAQIQAREAGRRALQWFVEPFKKFCKRNGLFCNETTLLEMIKKKNAEYAQEEKIDKKNLIIIDLATDLVKRSIKTHPSAVSNYVIKKVEEVVRSKESPYIDLATWIAQIIEEVYTGLFGLKLDSSNTIIKYFNTYRESRGRLKGLGLVESFLREHDDLLVKINSLVIEDLDLISEVMIKKLRPEIRTAIRRVYYQNSAVSEPSWILEIANQVLDENEKSLEADPNYSMKFLKQAVERSIDYISNHAPKRRVERVVEQRQLKTTGLRYYLNKLEYDLAEAGKFRKGEVVKMTEETGLRVLKSKIISLEERIRSSENMGRTREDDEKHRNHLIPVFTLFGKNITRENRDVFPFVFDSAVPLFLAKIGEEAEDPDAKLFTNAHFMISDTFDHAILKEIFSFCREISWPLMRFSGIASFFSTCRDLDVVLQLFDPRRTPLDDVIDVDKENFPMINQCYLYLEERLTKMSPSNPSYAFLETAYNYSRPMVGEIPSGLVREQKPPSRLQPFYGSRSFPTPTKVLQMVMLELLDGGEHPLRLDAIVGSAILKKDGDIDRNRSFELFSLLKSLVKSIQGKTFPVPGGHPEEQPKVLRIVSEIEQLTKNYKPAASTYLYEALRGLLDQLSAYYSPKDSDHPLGKLLTVIEKNKHEWVLDREEEDQDPLLVLLSEIAGDLPRCVNKMNDVANKFIQKTENFPETPDDLETKEWADEDIDSAFLHIGTFYGALPFLHSEDEYAIWLRTYWTYWGSAFRTLYLSNITRHITRSYYTSLDPNDRKMLDPIYNFYIGSHSAFQHGYSLRPPMLWAQKAPILAGDADLDPFILTVVHKTYAVLDSFPYGDHAYSASIIRDFFSQHTSFPTPFKDLKMPITSAEAVDTYSPAVLHMILDVIRCCEFHRLAKDFIQKRIISVGTPERSDSRKSYCRLNPFHYTKEENTKSVKQEYESIFEVFSTLSPRAQIMFKRVIDDVSAAFYLYGVILNMVKRLKGKGIILLEERFNEFMLLRDAYPSAFGRLSTEAQRLLAPRAMFVQAHMCSRIEIDASELKKILESSPNNMEEEKEVIKMTKKVLENIKTEKLEVSQVYSHIGKFSENRIAKEKLAKDAKKNLGRQEELSEFFTTIDFRGNTPTTKKRRLELLKAYMNEKYKSKVFDEDEAVALLNADPEKIKERQELAEYNANHGKQQVLVRENREIANKLRWNTNVAKIEESAKFKNANSILKGKITDPMNNVMKNYIARLGNKDRAERMLDNVGPINASIMDSEIMSLNEHSFILREDLLSLYDDAIGLVEGVQKSLEEGYEKLKSVLDYYTLERPGREPGKEEAIKWVGGIEVAMGHYKNYERIGQYLSGETHESRKNGYGNI